MLQEPKSEQRHLQVGWAVPASGAVRTRWQYYRLQTAVVGEIERVIAVAGEEVEPDTPIVEALDRLGNADWELVSVAPRGDGLLYIFKRPIAHHQKG